MVAVWTLALGTGLPVLSYEGIIGLLTSQELGHWVTDANRKQRPGSHPRLALARPRSSICYCPGDTY